MKKIVAFLFSMCCAFCLVGCKEFFEPLPEDFLETLYGDSTQLEDSSFEDEVVDTSSTPTIEDSAEDVVAPTDSSNEEMVDPLPPTDSSVEEELPTDEPTDEPIVPQETVSEPLAFAEGEHTIENLRVEATVENADAIYANGEGTVVTIESGYYDGGDNGSTTAVYARDGAKVVINGGTFKAGEGCAVVYAKNNAVVEINGGFFEADGAYNGTYFVLNLADNTNSTIIVTGGTFVNFNPADNASENPAVNFVAEGYEVVVEEQENGDTWFTVVKLAE